MLAAADAFAGGMNVSNLCNCFLALMSAARASSLPVVSRKS